MQLELKHLAGYLPYGLNCFGQGEIIEETEYSDNPIPKLLTITGLDANWVTVEGLRITVDESIMIEDCIPILRPLSDLTKEIEVNGEKFVPIEVLRQNFYKNLDIHSYLSGELFVDIETEDYSQTIDLMDGFLIIQKLYEWHFDIHNLIENNLAIDINTLNK